MDHLRALDALFLQVEDGTTHMHIGSCAVFEGPPPAFEELTDLIASKLPLLVRYRQRLRSVPGGFGRPVWVDDANFDVGYHVRHVALPPPGDEDTLDELMGRLMSQELDRSRPLWESWLVVGLADGRWALVSKVHHCMVDGIAGTDLISVMLDPDPDPVRRPVEPWTPAPPPGGVELVVDALGREILQAPGRVAAVGGVMRDPRRLARRVGETLDGLHSYVERLATPATPASIEGAIGRHRRWAAARCSLDDVKSVGRAFGGSVNDVVVAVTTGAFRELLLARGDDVDAVVLRSLVPMSVRAGGDHTANNQVTALIAELPIEIADPVERLRAVSAHLRALKSSHQAQAGVVLASAADLLPPPLVSSVVRGVASAARWMPQRRVNTVITNVPGPQLPLYACGRLMVDYLPFVPIASGVRIGVAVISYNGRMAFGVTGDYDSIPDVGRMAGHIEDGLDELVKLAAEHS